MTCQKRFKDGHYFQKIERRNKARKKETRGEQNRQKLEKSDINLCNVPDLVSECGNFTSFIMSLVSNPSKK